MLPSPKQWATTNGKSKAKAFLSNARQPGVDFLILTKNRLHTRTDTKQYKFVSINAYSKGKNASLPVDVCLKKTVTTVRAHPNTKLSGKLCTEGQAFPFCVLSGSLNVGLSLLILSYIYRKFALRVHLKWEEFA